MNQQPIDPDTLRRQIQAMQWETVSLAPDPQELIAIEQEVSSEWTQTLEAEREELLEAEILEPLYNKTMEELNAILDVPEGDIDLNARQALAELEIDTQAIMQEIEDMPSLEIKQTIDIDDDFGR